MKRIKDLGEKTIPFKSVEGVHRCMKFRCAKRCGALNLNDKGRASWRCRGAGLKRIRTLETIRDGTVIKLDVNTGVYTMDMRVCLDETLVRWSAGKDSEWPECHKQTCKIKGEVQQ